MKTTIQKPRDPENKLEFPLLARHIKSGGIYRFVDIERATVMLESNGRSPTTRESIYPEVTDKTIWEILPKDTQLIMVQ